MIKTSIELQDLRRKIYIKAKAEKAIELFSDVKCEVEESYIAKLL
ncbi:hypothetical protein [Orientia tsutsugamushi]|uniref:Uncharacterized protein n=1 Tax=Orientia tsutsugamushi TaxID=784 RepID=A0A2U3QSX5_ORITS|nr:hypothetical protein [Orientia tsutsugamushi]KJV54918.1 hypothetical protein OTSKATO_0863 [Orientia tsutsugamushi str. Kato PP]SPR04075.1 Uncharacterised protein [Orientia tsutsugamushi]SPR04579.1 Uncharacterised protein [Orientia tsutsugamushi]